DRRLAADRTEAGSNFTPKNDDHEQQQDEQHPEDEREHRDAPDLSRPKRLRRTDLDRLERARPGVQFVGEHEQASVPRPLGNRQEEIRGRAGGDGRDRGRRAREGPTELARQRGRASRGQGEAYVDRVAGRVRGLVEAQAEDEARRLGDRRLRLGAVPAVRGGHVERVAAARRVRGAEREERRARGARQDDDRVRVVDLVRIRWVRDDVRGDAVEGADRVAGVVVAAVEAQGHVRLGDRRTLLSGRDGSLAVVRGRLEPEGTDVVEGDRIPERGPRGRGRVEELEEEVPDAPYIRVVPG